MPKNKIILTNSVWSEGKSQAIGELIRPWPERVAKLCPDNGRLAVATNSALDQVAAAAWLAQTGRDGTIVPPDRLTESLARRLRAQGFAFWDADRGSLARPSHPVKPEEDRVTLLTSGTTGEPKLVEHTWASLFTMSRVRPPRAANWLLTYQGGTYAWFQMLTLLLFVPQQSLTLAPERSPAALFRAAREHAVTAISATPSLWRLAWLQVPHTELNALNLRQITLGGEPVDQPILDQLRQLYPDATLTHIYASTEAGACIIVHDGLEGFPAAWLAPSHRARASGETPQLQLRDGVLWIRSPYAVRNSSGWLNTGDRVEIRGERAIILGRAETAFINVGGAKVAAQEVERALLQNPAVLWCRVRRCPAPLVGELVGADVVFRSPAQAQPEAALAQHCAQRLPEFMVPRIWRFLDEIPVTDNLKTSLA